MLEKWGRAYQNPPYPVNPTRWHEFGGVVEENRTSQMKLYKHCQSLLGLDESFSVSVAEWLLFKLY